MEIAYIFKNVPNSPQKKWSQKSALLAHPVVLSIGEEFSPTYNQKHPKYSIFAVSLIRTSNLVIIIVIINLLSDLR